MQDKIITAVEQVAVNGEIACVDAHAVAAQLGISPLELGNTVTNYSKMRFYRCQLGLFGYGPKAEKKSKIVLPAQNVPADLEAALRARVVNGAIPCIAVWEIADQNKYPRLGMANIVQALGFKVAPCQLGCF